jgi:predicted ATP-dependent serine protease
MPALALSTFQCFACKATTTARGGELEPCECGCPESWLPFIAPARTQRERRAELASKVPIDETPRFPTGELELDRALWGGLAETSSAVLFGGEGVGKSRAALRIVSRLAPALVVSLEMPKKLCVDTAASAGANLDGFYVAETLDGWEHEAEGCRAILVDSLTEVPHAMTVARALRAWAARTRGVVLMVCQANAKGHMLGPRALRHLPDYVFRFTQGRRGFVRVSWKKSRYCPPGGAQVPIIE